jgi:glycerol uptake facilitator-like aquaporin
VTVAIVRAIVAVARAERRAVDTAAGCVERSSVLRTAFIATTAAMLGVFVAGWVACSAYVPEVTAGYAVAGVIEWRRQPGGQR